MLFFCFVLFSLCLLVVSRLDWVNTLNRKESPQRGGKEAEERRRGGLGSELGRSRRFQST